VTAREHKQIVAVVEGAAAAVESKQKKYAAVRNAFFGTYRFLSVCFVGRHSQPLSLPSFSFIQAVISSQSVDRTHDVLSNYERFREEEGKVSYAMMMIQFVCCS
jgi:hypothetical protein